MTTSGTKFSALLAGITQSGEVRYCSIDRVPQDVHSLEEMRQLAAAPGRGVRIYVHGGEPDSVLTANACPECDRVTRCKLDGETQETRAVVGEVLPLIVSGRQFTLTRARCDSCQEAMFAPGRLVTLPEASRAW
jgi:hypothetical protein